ncbi:MAG: carboxypeptidase-like regulatory domain-containing protein [Flavobacteriales bacterium]|nr:carboxypeptidase-like regulatory domain-containing protein [Flavobacteriales bacterium]
MHRILNFLLRSLYTIGIPLCCSTAVCAQPFLLRGTVYDNQTNETLPGASVKLKGATGGAITDIDGKFELSVPSLPPFTLTVSYVGYTDQEIAVTTLDKDLKVKLGADQVLLGEAEVIGSRISEKQKQAPLTVESMDLIAIKEAPTGDFYEGLGSLKGVDMTSASMGFKVINTRGFNSTSPVRSLQLIDGVDNQSPGLNFSLGNFLGASELDVMKVDLIVGASSAYYGPNAFNGVISMTTKDPYVFRGLSATVKGGERNLGEVALRYAYVFKGGKGRERSALKFNFYYMQANDWQANNYAPVEGTDAGENNPGGYDAVNRYGDEASSNAGITTYGLGTVHRDGYKETDLVDYDTRNMKASLAYHYKLNDSLRFIVASSFGTGTTVYQGDNRFRLQNILFYQNRIELNAGDKGFLRAYVTNEDAGDSYDAVFTAFRLQDQSKDDARWFQDYRNRWVVSGGPQAQIAALPGFPTPVFDPGPPATFIIDADAIEQFLLDNNTFVAGLHNGVRAYANTSATSAGTENIYSDRVEPGTAEYEAAFKDITTRLFSEGGTRFYDRSALWQLQGERNWKANKYTITGGFSFRQYLPYSKGNIFSDTSSTRITNEQGGVYVGAARKLLKSEKLKVTATARVDKNVNFPILISPAASAVYSFDPENILRFSFSSAIRNPTLQDQYLYYNVGRAVLLGNLNGVENLVTVPSLINSLSTSASVLEYFDVAAVVPEKVKTLEVGFRNTIGKNLFLDGSYYYSFYKDFLGFQLGADVDVIQSSNAVDLGSVQVYRVAANSTKLVTTQGFSIGANYFFWKFFAVNANYSWNKLNTVEDDPIIPAFNTPEHKYNLGLSARDISKVILGIPVQNWGFSVNYRWIQGFLFEGSPQFTGSIPSYGLLDAQINKTIPSINCTFKLGASNLLDNNVYMVYGGPQVGRLAYFSVSYEPDLRRK